MLKTHAGLIHRSLVAVDGIVSGLLFLFIAACTSIDFTACWGAHPLGLSLVTAVATLSFPLAQHGLGLYSSHRRNTLSEVCIRLLAASAVSSFAVGIAATLLAVPIAQSSPFYFGSTQFVVLGLGRLLALVVLQAARRHGRNTRNVLVVGSGPRGLRVRNIVEEHPGWGIRILGFVDDTETPVAQELEGEAIYKVAELPALLRKEVIDEVIVAYPRTMLVTVTDIVKLCSQIGIPVTVLSDLFGDELPSPRVAQLDTIPALSFAPVHHSAWKLAIKRSLDLALAGAGLLVLSPVLTLSAILIRSTSPGPAFFHQERCGLHGRRFKILKLRTMADDAENRKDELRHLNECDGPTFKIRRDPRITPVGRFLRRWSIDEVPQLWNVMRGEMSLVGPRPPIPSEVDQYRFGDQRRLSMRPGITCLWQVSGRSEIDFDDQVRLDLAYIDGWSLSTDLLILARTLPAVVSGRGAS